MSNIEINVPLYRRPVRVFHQLIVALINFYGSIQYSSKEFGPFLSFGCPSAGTKVKIT